MAVTIQNYELKVSFNSTSDTIKGIQLKECRVVTSGVEPEEIVEAIIPQTPEPISLEDTIALLQSYLPE